MSLKQLVVFGPLPPHRGGIAKHTLAMSNALTSHWDITVMAPRKLYPRFLYPGASERSLAPSFEASDRKFAELRGSDLGVFFAILFKRKFDHALMPWWTTARAPQTLALALALKIRKTPMTFFCHNVLPHDSSPIARHISKLILRNGATHLVQAKSELERLNDLLPGSRGTRVSHPRWEEPQMRCAKPAGERFLFFGMIRKYKGIQVLIDAVPLLTSHSNLEIVIMGEVWDNQVEADLRQLQRQFPCVRLELGYVDDEKIADAFLSCRAVLMPYLSATGSGVLALAKQYSRPVIASGIEPFNSEVRPKRDGLLFAPSDAAALADAIEQFAGNTQLGLEAWDDSETANYSWANLADDITTAMRNAK